MADEQDLRSSDGAQTFPVGYLSPDQPFPTGHVSDEDRELLRVFRSVPYMSWFGYHTCEFCGAAKGTTDFLVFAANGDAFLAPELILHYIERHHYLPPEPFMRALKEGPHPPQQAYFQRLRLYEEIHEFSRNRT